MHILAILEIIVQVYFAIHAGRSGRYGWIFIILFFPLIGSIVYFFIEYLPELQMTAKANSTRKRTKTRNIRHLKKELELVDSVTNRINLAEAYFYSGQFQKSIDLLKMSLTGVHSDDLAIIEGLCYSYFYNGSVSEAIYYLNRYETVNNGKLKHNLRLLRAKANEKQGNLDDALQEYKDIINHCPGEEARCRYALLLKNKGQIEKSEDLFKTIIKNANLYPKPYSKAEKEWIQIAKTEIK